MLTVAVLLAVVAILVWPGRSLLVRRSLVRRSLVRGSLVRRRELTGAPPTAPVDDRHRTRWRSHRRSSARAAGVAEGRLADLLGLVAAPLQAGVPAPASLAAGATAVTGDPLLAPLVEELVARGAAGEPVSDVWLEHARRLDSNAVRFVGQAWALSERTGAPLADALRSSEAVLRARIRSRQRLDSAAAGPRASMGVLALLPLTGPVVGLACGVGPVQLYLATPWSTASLVLGIAFAVFGWWWSRSILKKAA